MPWSPCVERMERNKKRAIIRWAIYWSLIFGVYIAVSIAWGSFAVFLIIPFLAALNFAIQLIVGLPITRIQNQKIKTVLRSVANIISLTATISICHIMIVNGSNYNEAYINSLDYSVFQHKSIVTYNPENGVYTVRAESDELKILQLTDIHICGSITTIGTDRKSLDACYALIKETQPDLIIVTGDIVYTVPFQTFNKNNLKPIYQFCAFMNNIGTPWAMVYGNHDTESVATYDSKTLEGLFRHFKLQEDCPMLYAEKQPDIYGRYNQYLLIENCDESLNRLIFLIDSNDYIQNSIEINDYDSVHKDQIEWYADTIDLISETEQETVKSFVFMHIPFKEFADAKDALDAGEQDAVYLFGENGEKTCFPEHNSGFFDVILDKNSTDAVFVGHDHLNNIGIKYKGVDLVCSKSIDYIAYPEISQMTEQRGATLITILQNGEYRIKQVNYNK